MQSDSHGTLFPYRVEWIIKAPTVSPTVFIST